MGRACIGAWQLVLNMPVRCTVPIPVVGNAGGAVAQFTGGNCATQHGPEAFGSHATLRSTNDSLLIIGVEERPVIPSDLPLEEQAPHGSELPLYGFV